VRIQAERNQYWQQTALEMASPKVRLAILDDYDNIAPPKFSHLSSKVEVSSFKDTLNVRQEDQKKKQIDRLQPFAIISTMRERTAFPKDVVDQLPNLKLLLTTGMKNASIDVGACAERGIPVVGAKAVGKPGREKPLASSLDSTTEQNWALILGLARKIAQNDASVKSGGWQTGPAVGLKGKTLGVLGLGKLGSDTARLGVAFGMKVIAWSQSLTQEKAHEQAVRCNLPAGVFKVVASKEALFREADVVSIHYVLSDRSRGIVGASELAAMKPTAVLVNTSRGPLVDESALLDALDNGKIAGAALDVFDTEPLPDYSPWRTIAWGKDGRADVVLSPHMGYVEKDVMDRWYEDTAVSVESWLEGRKLENQIN
jgi:phosphoglycerate dehydrogenase-like enzyme